MNAKLIRMYQATKSDEGQGTLEYIGMLVVVVALIGVAVAAAGGLDLATGFQDLVDRVLGQ